MPINGPGRKAHTMQSNKPVPPTREQSAAGGRISGERRRRQTAREIATEATAVAVERILLGAPPLTDDQRDRLRNLLAQD